MATKFIMCDLPNTLFDSRHRMFHDSVYMTGIELDTLNYSALSLLKELMRAGYTPIFTHYCLYRLSGKVQRTFQRLTHIETDNLFTNIAFQTVYDNTTLKKYVADMLMSKGTIYYAIDNDPNMSAYWLNHDISLIQVPLSIEISDKPDETEHDE